MEFNLKLSTDHVRVLLGGLDKLEHGIARPTFDALMVQIQEQEKAHAEQQKTAD